jgi:hypothetical protein
MFRQTFFLFLFGLLVSPAVGQEEAVKPPDPRAGARLLEPWADPGLKVTRGLLLWLDAGRLNAARRAFGRPEAVDGGKVGVWYDGSGHGRHFAQMREQAQPV